jgi:threonine synthase
MLHVAKEPKLRSTPLTHCQVMLSLLRDQGITTILEDSSGNGGASVACYAAAGGLKATIMAPESTSAAKTVAMRAYGAEVGAC